MKLLPFLLLGTAGVVLGAIALWAPEATYEAPREVPRHLEAAVPAGHVVHTFEVEGMCCDGCSGRVFNAALKVPGVRAAAIRVEASALEAVCDSSVDATELARILSFDKYTVSPRP